MDEFFDGIGDVFNDLFSGITTEVLTNWVVGFFILVFGWLLARFVAYLVYRGLHKVRTDERFAKIFSPDSEVPAMPIERWVSRIVFYVLMLIVFIGFFERFEGGDLVATPLGNMLEDLADFGPGLIGALLILFVAFVVASVARWVVIRGLALTKIDETISETAHLGKDAVSHSLAQGIFWLVYLIFLPAVFEALGLSKMVEPITDLVGSILAGIPNLLSAGIILFLGWVLARIVRQIISNLLDATNVDRFGEQVGLTDEQSISELLGLIGYILVFITALSQALETLALDAISRPLVVLLDAVNQGILNLVGAFVIVGVAYYIGKLLSGFVTNVLTGVGFDTIPEKLGFNYKPAKDHRTLSDMAGYLVTVIAVLLASIEAAGLLGIQVLAESLEGLLDFGGQAIGALIILAVGVYLANLIRSIILSAGGEHAGDFANVARTITLVFVIVIAITQLDIGGDIVRNAFIIILGTAGVAAALAFGLGARDVAGKQVETWVKNWKKK